MKCSVCLADKEESEFNYCKHNNKYHKKCKECFKQKLLTDSEYQSLFEEQGGKCAICREESKIVSKYGKLFKLCIDHDHKTGEVRGLLCFDCNIALGRFKDSQMLLASASRYLSEHS